MNACYDVEMERIILKIGTGVLTTEQNDFAELQIEKIIDSTVTFLNPKRHQLVLVSSGAIGLGRRILEIEKPEDLATKQLCASIGQAHLIEGYQKALGKHGFQAAQVLLTSEDLKHSEKKKNLISVLKQMEGKPIVCVVNENDVISTEEIKPLKESESNWFSDNDRLSALLSKELEAQTLVILMDGKGIFLKKPSQEDDQPMTAISDLSDFESIEVWKSSKEGRGGILSKIESVKFAAGHGVNTWITSGFNFVGISDFFKNLDNKDIPKNGTFVFGKGSKWKSN